MWGTGKEQCAAAGGAVVMLSLPSAMGRITESVLRRGLCGSVLDTVYAH